MDFFEQARTAMVKCQVMPGRVSDERIISVMAQVPRHQFAAEGHEEVAYFDGRLNVGEGRTIPSPETFARMAQALALSKHSKLLDIAPARGYSTTVFAQLVADVVAVEANPTLARICAHNISQLGLTNVTLKNAEIYSGDAEFAPYDAIFVGGLITREPKELLAQLAEGGRLVCVMIPEDLLFNTASKRLQKVYLFEKHQGAVSKIELFDAFADKI